MAKKSKKVAKKKPAVRSKIKASKNQLAMTREQRVWDFLDRKRIDRAIVYFEGGSDDGYAYDIELVRGNKVVEQLDALVLLKHRNTKRPPIEWLLQEPIYDAFIFEGGRLFKDVITWDAKTRRLKIPSRRGRRQTGGRFG
jgi:hypothetical protein